MTSARASAVRMSGKPGTWPRGAVRQAPYLAARASAIAAASG